MQRRIMDCAAELAPPLSAFWALDGSAAGAERKGRMEQELEGALRAILGHEDTIRRLNSQLAAKQIELDQRPPAPPTNASMLSGNASMVFPAGSMTPVKPPRYPTGADDSPMRTPMGHGPGPQEHPRLAAAISAVTEEFHRFHTDVRNAAFDTVREKYGAALQVKEALHISDALLHAADSRIRNAVARRSKHFTEETLRGDGPTSPPRYGPRPEEPIDHQTDSLEIDLSALLGDVLADDIQLRYALNRCATELAECPRRAMMLARNPRDGLGADESTLW